MSPPSYSELLRRDRRLAILRTLAGAPGLGANESQLERMCNQFKVWSTRTQIITELLWLEEQGFVLLEDIEGYKAATARDDGVKIAQGIRHHPEVTSPSAPR